MLRGRRKGTLPGGHGGEEAGAFDGRLLSIPGGNRVFLSGDILEERVSSVRNYDVHFLCAECVRIIWNTVPILRGLERFCRRVSSKGDAANRVQGTAGRVAGRAGFRKAMLSTRDGGQVRGWRSIARKVSLYTRVCLGHEKRGET